MQTISYTQTPTDASVPRISVLMPTYRQAVFLPRAIESLAAQHLQSWELLIVNDGSPDDTAEIVAGYSDDPRIRYFSWEQNRGIGEALNFATQQACGSYLAYLPSDDIYYPRHLGELAAYLDTHTEHYLAYSGVVVHHDSVGWSAPTLQGAAAVHHELAALDGNVPSSDGGPPLTNNNILALVQVMHRRSLEARVRWTTRSECVSDYLEADYWRALLLAGATFGYAGRPTCEWTDHPDQHHKIIAQTLNRRLPYAFVPWARSGRGLTGYRAYYHISPDEPINWRSSAKGHEAYIDEVRIYTRFREQPASQPAHNGLKILLVGSLGFNPERIRALAEAGHVLFGLWVPFPEPWDYAAPPGVPITTIPYGKQWRDQVEEIKPDVIYALLNRNALPLIDEVAAAGLDIPIAFHFKESPFSAIRYGLWDNLKRILRLSAGHIFISEENLDWHRLQLPSVVGNKPTMILDGDLPKLDWMSNDFTPRLGRADGNIHTVFAGRPVGLDDLDGYMEAGIHVHCYGQSVQQNYETWVKRYAHSDRLHLHPPVTGTEWVAELSRYDAAWLHIFDSYNEGDLRAASWHDLNVPARVGTYVTAGLPLIMRDNQPSVTAVQSLASRHDIGVPFTNVQDLYARLSDEKHMTRLRENVRRIRSEFAFDTHVPTLTQFLRALTRG